MATTDDYGTPIEAREEIYRWMNRWLNNGQGDWRDEAVRIYTNRELQVTASGNVDNEPGSRKLHQIIQKDFVAARSPRGVRALQSELKRLGVVSNGANNITLIDAEHIRFESEPGVTITAKLYLPKGEGRKPAIVIVEENRLWCRFSSSEAHRLQPSPEPWCCVATLCWNWNRAIHPTVLTAVRFLATG